MFLKSFRHPGVVVYAAVIPIVRNSLATE